MDVRYRALTALLWGSVATVSAVAIAQQAPTNPTTAAAPMADNTKVNERDKSQTTLTAFNQPNNAADLKVAADVRKAIVDEKSLSVMGHNVKLVAANGAVTLRGPVQNTAEKAKIEQIVARVGGVLKVDNQLDVKNQ
jgi:osmotically-inducible protein OsmY